MCNLYHILVIDDDASVLKTVAEYLEDTYTVSLASSAAVAMALLAKGVAPDAILLDIDMPGMNGYDFLTHLKSQTHTFYIPVLFLTGAIAPEQEVRGLQFGAVDYIKKPFIPEILSARLATHIQTARQRTAPQQLDEAKLAALPEALTGTEQKVARMLVMGYSNEEISKELNYSYDYVKKIVSRILAKLGISTRTEIKHFVK